MPNSQTTSENESTADNLLQAILPHVPFDGWSEAAFLAACTDLDITPQQGRGLCPRGAVDLAVAFHRAGDRALVAQARQADFTNLRYSEKVAALIQMRLEGADREVVRRGTVLFALPNHAAEGARLIWETADTIWTALGDTSDDINWYSKRVILSGVYGSVVLYWLGDESGGDNTRDFIDRRIADVMRFEKVKAGIRSNPVLGPIAKGVSRLFSGIRAPQSVDQSDLPGRWTPPGAP